MHYKLCSNDYYGLRIVYVIVNFQIGPSSDAMANTLYRVKFLILKNIASIAKDKDEVPRAISAYLEV